MPSYFFKKKLFVQKMKRWGTISLYHDLVFSFETSILLVEHNSIEKYESIALDKKLALKIFILNLIVDT